MIKAVSVAVAILATTFSTSTLAAQFKTMIDAIAISKKVDYNTHMWDNTQKIEGVKWKWPYYESGAHDSTMIGITKVGNSSNPNIGATEITITGSRMNINAINIRIENTGENPSKSAVANLFGSEKIKKIASSCDMDYATEADATYEFQKLGYQPVFIRYSASWGASDAGSINIDLSNHLYTLTEYC